MSALTDRARDFWDRISPRERKLVALLVIAAPITIAIWLGTSISDGLDSMQARNDKTRRALSVIQSLRERGTAAASPEEDLVKSIGTEPISLDTYLDAAAKKAGFTIKGTSPHTPVTRNGFITTSVSLSVDDLEIDKLKTFLQEIETSSKLVVITSLETSRDRRERTKIDAKLVVSTYAKVKPEGEATGEGAGSAQKGS